MENDPLVAQMEDLEVQRTRTLFYFYHQAFSTSKAITYRNTIDTFPLLLDSLSICFLLLPTTTVIAGAVHSLRPTKAALHPA